ncbi:TIM barrel protein [Pseudoxanthomonas sp. JBR18]|uniref:hydroxypyruvate isomerase family protein n=1 Tax=Pseudoxanthomonas sp. JBR18 TaxID=2969308 RepID=UPI002305CB5F|nr:TIM barrel protein [Pseudoxanthomonas sp. JBR18]WCE06026.1 TIM barrel protein [Pseudoxanthomonas sp. JBR18]
MTSSLNRRDLLRGTLLGGIGLAASTRLPALAQAAPTTKGHLKQSVARWILHDLSIDQLCRTVKQLGLSAIDLVGPADWPTLKAHGIDSAMCNGAELGLTKGFAATEFHDELVTRYMRHIDLVAEAGYRNLICFSGNRNGMDPLQGMRNAEVGLKRLLGHAEKRGVVLVMELLNSRVDHPDYLCDHSAWGVELCKRIGSSNFGLLFDIYHMQIMEGDIIASIRRNHEYFVHYHTAGVPGRHELDDTQELNYAAICRAIRDTGFGGYVAHEFSAEHSDPMDALRQAIALCDV